MKQYIEIHPEVQEALDNNKPVVALESTIIAHGFPYPKNLETGLGCEKIIRDNGAVPATIAIINGVIKVGLTQEEIEYLASCGNAIKTSRRDIPFVVASKATGDTTVSATMIIAELVGIKVFATGGIGGVHREAQDTFDISADIEELGKTSVAVVCAGAKSILDLGLTMECLETNGVPVIGYGVDKLPSFYTRSSEFKVDYQLNSPIEIAKAIKIKWDLNIKGGLVIANPIPEEYELDSEEINIAIDKALAEAKDKGIKGKETTPFILSKLVDVTEGKSIGANIQLVYNNSDLAAKIAIELNKL